MIRATRVRVSAPVRLDFAGGWTDVAPYATDVGGVVVNAAIDLRTTVTIEFTDGEYLLESRDQELRARARTPGTLDADSGLQLHHAALSSREMAPCAIRSDAWAPAGSGLGTSGALSVALIAAIGILHGEAITLEEVAHRAWELETIGAAVAGGKQDQYASALGGFQRLAFHGDTVDARSLPIGAETAEHLAAHLVVCHTGRSRFSGSTITRVMDGYRAGDAAINDALSTMAGIAEAMAPALQTGNLTETGRLLQLNWQQQLRLDPAMRTEGMARLEDAVMAAGAIGGKAAGAGAGGVMFFVVPGDGEAVRAAATGAGATILPVRWAPTGVRQEPGRRGNDDNHV